MQEVPPRLSERFLAAVDVASEIHGHERRLGTRIPYMAHLLVVAGLVLEDGGGETDAIGAMLHDAVEDGGGLPALEHIRSRFGDRVAEIVLACSDTLDAEDRRGWRERKAAYLEHLDEVSDDAVLRVVLADKVNNARSIVRDYRAEGGALWERFTNRTADDQLWYYEELLGYFTRRRDGPLVEDLREAVGDLADLLASSD
jgi:(p)ppGpp synthase/HD superfamily hydrolase